MMMKTLSFFFLLAASMNCFAQDKEPKNEIAISLFSLEYDEVDFLPFYFSSAQYKRRLQTNYFLRVTAAAYQKTYEYDLGEMFSSYSEHSEGKIKWLETRVGLAKEFSYKKIRPYVFLDLSYMREVNIGNAKGNSDFPPYYYDNNYNYTYQYAGLLWGAGIKYEITRRLFVNLETSYSAYYPIFEGGDHKKIVFAWSPVKMFGVGVRF